MSNNKQSSVEWLWYKFISCSLKVSDVFKLLEQAKAMHKEEIENAYDDGWHDNNDDQYNPINYYNKTFGGQQ